MKAIHTRSTACQLLADDGRAIQWIGKWLAAKVPCAEKIILRSRASDGWLLCAVDKEHVVAFAPPKVLVLQHRHGDTYILSMPFRIHPDIIPIAIQIRLIVYQRVLIVRPRVGPAAVGLRLPILRVKIKSIGRQRMGVGPVIDVVIESGNWLLPLIRNRDVAHDDEMALGKSNSGP